MPFNLSLALAVTIDGGTQTATAAVTGATAGRTVNLYRAAWQTTAGQRSWTLAGSGVASGAGSASISDVVGATGNYEWLAVQLTAGGDADALSTIYYGAIVDPDVKSVWEQCCDHLKTAVDSLLLTDLPAAKVIKRWYPGEFKGKSPEAPSVQICPFGSEDIPGVLNNTDDVTYPVILVTIDRVDGESAGNLTRDLLWREKISRAVRFQVPAGISEVYMTDLAPEVLVHPDLWEMGIVASGLVFLYRSRERRGIY